MKIDIDKYFKYLVLLIIVVLIFKAMSYMYQKEKSINENKYETIGKVYKFYSNKNFSYYYYKYSYNRKIYENNDDIDDFGGQECVGKYYKVYLSTKNPQFSKILLDEEVTDSTKTLNLGFKD